MGEFDEVAQGTVARIDAVVVRDIVSVVLGGRRMERHQPNRGDAKPVQIVQTAQQAFEIADAVAIGIHVGADGQAIYHAVLIPEVINHRAGPRWSALRSQWRPWYKRRGAFRVPRASQFVPPVTAAQNRFAIGKLDRWPIHDNSEEFDEVDHHLLTSLRPDLWNCEMSTFNRVAETEIFDLSFFE